MLRKPKTIYYILITSTSNIQDLLHQSTRKADKRKIVKPVIQKKKKKSR